MNSAPKAKQDGCGTADRLETLPAGLDMAVRGARDQVQKKTPDVRRQFNNYFEEQVR